MRRTHVTLIWLLLSSAVVALSLSGVAQVRPVPASPAPASSAPTSSAPKRSAAGAKPVGHAATGDMDCSACHTAAAWDAMGNTDGGGFDHDRTGFPLRARHAEAGCMDCHVSGQRITRACSGCHQDPHDRRLGEDCSACHTAVSFSQVDVLQQHRNTRLPLTGVHVLLDCSQCHQRRTDGTFTGAPPNCYACHSDDYSSPAVHPRHTGTPGDPSQPPFPTDCALCHRAFAWSPAVVDPAQLRVESAAEALRAPESHELRFPLRTGVHRALSCDSCHMDRARPELFGCVGCHAHAPARLRAQHETPLPAGADGRTCLSCHPGGVAR